MNKITTSCQKAFNPLIVVFLFLLSSMTIQAQNNYGISFNGSSSADCGTGTGFNISGTAITIEAWIYPTSFASNYWGGSIISKDGQNITGYVLRCGGAGQLSFVIAVTGNVWVEVVSANNALTLNQWQHVTGVYDGSNLSIYVNGVLAGSVAENRTLLEDASFPVEIGTSSGNWVPSRNFTGIIDEARAWNVSKTVAEIKYNMFRHISTGTGLVASYQMSDGSGTSITDDSGNGNTATLTAGASWVASPIQFAGNALSFDGIDDYVNIPYNSSLDISSAITLESWVYATKNTGIQDVISKSSNATNTGYIFPRTDDGWAHAVLYLHIGGAWRVLSAPYPSLNAWHHLAATYDGATMKIYIDGTLAASGAQTGTIATNTNVVALGNQTGYNEYFGGYADEFRIWNVARTQAQIQTNMNNELNPATQTGLVSYYTADQGIAAGTNTGLVTLVDQSGTNNGTLTNFALSGSISNYISQESGLTVLPVQWLSFTVQPQGSHALLQWSTSNELNTSDFTVQRSLDGLSWNNLTQIAAAVNSSTVSNYSYVDAQPGTGINFYRIRQDDIDGHYSYSFIVAVHFDQVQPAFTLLNNPVINDMLQLNINKAGVFSIYNALGNLILKQNFSEGPAFINLNTYPKGVYLLQSDNEIKKFLLQ